MCTYVYGLFLFVIVVGPYIALHRAYSWLCTWMIPNTALGAI